LRRVHSFASVALVFASGAAGCIFFVNDDPSKLAVECHFAGDESACGACIASACASQASSCCGESACAASLEGCAGGVDAGACTDLVLASPTLGACVATSCSVCLGFPPADSGGGADSGGQTNCTNVGDGCFCTVGSPNGQPCSVQSLAPAVQPGLCCADYGWPMATNSTCSCEPFSCTPTSTGASCTLSSTSTRTTSWGGYCCAIGGPDCFCDNSSSPGCTTPLTQCTVNDVTCGSGQVNVPSCSF
jgi:hypothetical protein